MEEGEGNAYVGAHPTGVSALQPCHESEPLFDGCLTPPEEEGLPGGEGRGKEKKRGGQGRRRSFWEEEGWSDRNLMAMDGERRKGREMTRWWLPKSPTSCLSVLIAVSVVVVFLPLPSHPRQ